MMTQSLKIADYFEAVAVASREPKLAANWIMGEVVAAPERGRRSTTSRCRRRRWPR